jgi:probable phosphoglycerate mutase
VDAIYSSPLERTRETAAPIARARRRAVRIERGLLECDFGDWTGKKLSDLVKKPEWGTVQRHPTAFRFPGGESFLEVQDRAVSEILRICEAHPDALVAAFSHADVVKLVLAHFAGMHQDAFQRLVVDPCSVSVVSVAEGIARVVKINDTGDLAHLVPAARAPRRGSAATRRTPSRRQVRG